MAALLLWPSVVLAEPIPGPTDPPADAVAWYRIQPAFHGPFVAVSFSRDSDGWTARRAVIVDDVGREIWPDRPSIQMTDEARCPGLADAIETLEPLLTSGVDIAGTAQGLNPPPPPPMDGWTINVGARGVLTAQGGYGTLTIAGNGDLAAAAWALETDEALAACWTPTAEPH